MALTAGARLGPYEILSAIGAGGMGEVYRARDTKLGRDVAIKILPDAFVEDGDRRARFEREARTLASLSHPNIAQIYGIEDRALVMELVEGEDLSAVIARGPIPIEDALDIARQMALALGGAHELGIVHRDIKPANVKVTREGVVKVLDFGLAKAIPETSAAPVGHTNITTLTAATQVGAVLGTASYMAPEQIKGLPVDRRADVWAFGVVLFEMLTGGRLYKRDDITETMAAVLTTEPDLATLPAATPAPVRRLLARCLNKDRRQRLDSLTAARLDLDEASRTRAVASGDRNASVSLLFTAIVALGALAVGITGTRLWSDRGRTDAAPLLYTQIGAPAGVISAFHDGFALSPDGMSMAFVARAADGQRQIWFRRLDNPVARPIAGTADGIYPFWSPDNAEIAFFNTSALRRVRIDGAAPQTICTMNGVFRSGSWSDGGDILFAVTQGQDQMIYKVAAAGGKPVPLDVRGRTPQWLPGGRQFVVATVVDGRPTAMVVSLADGASRTVAELPSLALAYSSTGYLITSGNDAMTVTPVDPKALTVRGPSIAIAGRGGTPRSWLAVSSAGEDVAALAAVQPGSTGNPGNPPATLRWVNRRGERIGELGPEARYWTLRLSPDGRRALVNADNNPSILEPDAQPVRFTNPGEVGVWSPDGGEVVVTWAGNLVRKRLDKSDEGAVLPDTQFARATDWSRDGRWLLFATGATGPASSVDVWLYDLVTSTKTGWRTTSSNENQARFSPDGQRIAYVSDETGQAEVYLAPRVGGEPGKRVSSGGGLHPAWSGDGHELFYLGPNDDVMAVNIPPAGSGRAFGKPTSLFRVPLNDVYRTYSSPFDVTPDGQRFLLNVAERAEPLLYIRGLGQLLKNK